MTTRVVVTGMGLVTPLGQSVDKTFDHLLRGRHGFGPLTLFDDPLLQKRIVAEIKDFEPKDHMDRKLIKRTDRCVHLALAASREAIEQSGLDLGSVDPYDFGIQIGTGVGGISSYFENAKAYLKQGPSYVNPICVPKFIPNMVAGHLSMTYGARGQVSSIVTACAAGTHAIGEAYRLIKDGYQKVILAGGSDACINPVMLSGFVNMQAHTLSIDPDKASRPFDRDRSGFVLGEGAGVLIMESYDHAKARGATILGEVVGYGHTGDGYHMTSPDPEGNGVLRCMENALKEASLSPDQVAYINAHGTGTLMNDAVEAQAIERMFGQTVLVNSTKSMVGHLMGAGGAVEAIICLKSMKEGQLHPSIGIDQLDTEINIIRQVTPINGTYAMSNSFGFGGHNGSLVFKVERE
jgi:3-oxoacyl-[acyl-carrier-protein] synthase II